MLLITVDNDYFLTLSLKTKEAKCNNLRRKWTEENRDIQETEN